MEESNAPGVQLLGFKWQSHTHKQSPRVLYVTPAPRFFICKMDLKWHARACVCMLSCFSCVQHFVTLWTMPRQIPLSMRFSRHKY